MKSLAALFAVTVLLYPAGLGAQPARLPGFKAQTPIVLAQARCPRGCVANCRRTRLGSNAVCRARCGC